MELKIEKLIYGGDGLGRVPASDPQRGGKAIFVPFTILGETVTATITEEKPGFARARLGQVVEASGERTQPGCPYFGSCGGCQYQHMSYDAQLRAKAEILRETIQRTAKITPPEVTVHPSPPWNYRNRTRMRVRVPSATLQSHSSGGVQGFAVGYNKFASHELLPVRECPISSPLINLAISLMWKLGDSGRVPANVVEVEYFVNAEDTELLLEVTLADERTRPSLRKVMEFANAFRGELPQCVGVVPFAQSGKSVTRLDVTPAQQLSFGRDSLFYRTAHMQYQVGGGSFFQTNRYLVDTIVALTTQSLTGEHALDLYSGVGLFALALSQVFEKVTAVEVAPFSFHDLKANSLSNMHSRRIGVDQFLIESESRFDYIIVDPPRGGIGEASTKLLAELGAPKITYVSCDPATLARDLKILYAHGYRMHSLHLLDMFPQTFHIETIVQLSL